MMPAHRVETQLRVSADLRPADFEFGDCVYMMPNGTVTANPNGAGLTNPLVGRVLGGGRSAQTINVLTQPLIEPDVVDAVTQLGDIVR